MPCYSPANAFKCADGSIVFSQLKRHGDIIGDIKVPCGQCIGCRIDRAQQWAIRCLHEAKIWQYNCFVTLTYDDANLPANGGLDYRDFQLFIKRLRKELGPLRFFMCGEYGEETFRPHYHAILFGMDFADKVYVGKSATGYPVYTSAKLNELWRKGNCQIGSVSKESAGYVARYCMKKVTGDLAEARYGDKEPEFCRMSLKPGIGADFFFKYQSDILPNDYIIMDGFKAPVPKYYDKLFVKNGGDLEEIQYQRELCALQFRENQTPERLAVRAEVAARKLKMLSRGKVK